MPIELLEGQNLDFDSHSGSAHASNPTFAKFQILKLNETAVNKSKHKGDIENRL